MNVKILEIAFSQYGIHELPGMSANSPQILRYFNDIGHKWVKTDETAWCSAFANWVALHAGVEQSGKLNARSWLNVGENIENPMLGDVVVFWRDDPKSWKGHVAFYINQDDNFIYCLGGNQRNKVCISAYSKERLLAYKRLKPVKP